MGGVNLQSITKQAEKIALSVDESVREAAYNRAFDFLLQQGGFGNIIPNKQNVSAVKSKPENSEAITDEVTILMQIDRTAHTEVLNASSVLDRSLHLLRIANDEYQIDGLKASQIAKVLTDNFRLGTTRQAVAQALDNAGDKVNAVTIGKGAVYRIMARGESYLDNEVEQDSGQTTSTASNKNNGKSARTKKVPKPDNTKAQESTSKKRNGRPGPKAVIMGLITTGFFNKPKMINDIQSEIENAQGYRYKSTDLSPALVRLLRDKMIVRERNAEGQYEYKSK